MSKLALLITGARQGMYLSWVDDDTIQISAGSCVIGQEVYYRSSTLNVTFANLDTGSRAVGVDYYVWAVPGTDPAWNIVLSASASAPTGYSDATLLGYFHNGRDYVGGGSDGAIFRYSVVSNSLIQPSTPYIAHPDLPAGIPLPGMVRVGGFAIGIYAAARADATGAAAGSSYVPRSHYGVVPWVSIQGFEANAVAAAAGCRLPTLWEWWMAAMFNPGSGTLVARQNGNTGYGSSSDSSGYLASPGAPTVAVGAAGALSGNYYYEITLVNATGETQAGTASALVAPSSQQVDLTSIPTGAAGCTARKIYRTTAGGGTYKLLATIADNTTTTYTDNIADGSLGANAPAVNTTGNQQATSDPTHGAGRTLVGTGPRTASWGAPGAGVSWYSPIGCADMVGNVWEWAAYLGAGIYDGAGYGSSKDWGYGDGDRVYNVDSYAYHPQTSGYTQQIPAMALLGGSWDVGSDAGVRALRLINSPGGSSASIGFRLAR